MITVKLTPLRENLLGKLTVQNVIVYKLIKVINMKTIKYVKYRCVIQ
jgi:hypothetical protein